MLYRTPQQDYRNTCLNALIYLQTNGWCQGQSRTGDGRACLDTAIKAAAHNDYERTTATFITVADALDIPYGSHTSWNDAKNRIYDEVVDLLRQLAFL